MLGLPQGWKERKSLYKILCINGFMENDHMIISLVAKKHLIKLNPISFLKLFLRLLKTFYLFILRERE